MIVDEAVRGHVPPLWFWALPGLDRIRAFDQSQLPSPPITRLLGIRAGHVGPGSGTWVMPATGWSSIATGELEVSMLAETAATGVAMTTLTPGLDVEPVSLALNYFRPTRPQAGNLLARARVVNASRLFVFVEIEVEDPQGRKVAHGTSHCEVRQVEPSPPELTGCRIEAIDEEQGAVTMAMTMPATEWLCRFSRCVAPGAIASLANSCSLTSGWLLVQPGQSFAGLAHSTSFFRTVPADGRLLRAKARGMIRGRGLAIVDIDVYDADGQLAASAHASRSSSTLRSVRNRR